MFLIWRGWGALAVGFPLLGVAVMMGIWSAAGASDGMTGVFIGTGLLLGGVGAYLFGRWINEQRPVQQAEQFAVQRREQLHQLVRSGQFQMAPGMAQPRTYEEAYAQADHLLQQEVEHLRPRLRNVHTVFWIPMQWVGLLVAAIGVIAIVASLLTPQ